MIDRFCCRMFRWTFALTLGVMGATAANDSAAEPRLSSAMSWDDTYQAMERYPPSFDYADERLKIMQSMDRLIRYSVKHVSDEDRAKLKPWLEEMVEFYRRRVDRGLDALEETRVVEGVHLFKFYSSSVILKSADGTVSLDFCQGPVNNAGEPEESDLYQSGFYLTRKQRDRLARLIDVALITHRHHDHADFSLARRMAAAGKAVIGPAQLKTHWPDLAHAITVPKYETVQRFGPCEILAQFGYQYAASRTGPDGQRYGMHPPGAPERSSETARYLLRLGGITFLQSAESQTEAYDWLEKANSLGWQVDVLFKPGQYQGARSVMRYLEGHDYFQVPIHEYELMHEGGGNRTAPLLQGGGRDAFDRKRSMPLLWGEDYLLVPRTRWRDTPDVSESRSGEGWPDAETAATHTGFPGGRKRRKGRS